MTDRDDQGANRTGFAPNVSPPTVGERDSDHPLDHSEQSFRLLVEGVQDYAIFMLEPTGRVITWNEGAARIKGYRADEIIGESFVKFYPPEDVASHKPQRALETAAREGKYEDEGWRVRKGGTKFWASVLITALRNPAGELLGFAKVTRDLTERRESQQRAVDDARRLATEEAARSAAEKRESVLGDLADKLRHQTVELEARRREAEEAQRRADDANRIKSEFLAAMSHELRTPLNAIGGYTNLLALGLSGPVTRQQLEQLERIKRSQDHLLGIINDILNFSRIEAGQLTYNLGAVPIHAVIDAALQMLAPQAKAQGLHFEAGECPHDLVAWADPAKVDQIVLNLISNAMKFTESGGRISLSCKRLDGDRVALNVHDTGCGIAEDQLQNVFEPFVQIGRTLTSPREGTGLGLAISRDLAQAMHGDILVASKPDVGSTFTLTLPLQAK